MKKASGNESDCTCFSLTINAAGQQTLKIPPTLTIINALSRNFTEWPASFNLSTRRHCFDSSKFHHGWDKSWSTKQEKKKTLQPEWILMISQSVFSEMGWSQMANSSTMIWIFFFIAWLAPKINRDALLSLLSGSAGSLVFTTCAVLQLIEILKLEVLLFHMSAMWFQFSFHTCSHTYLRRRVLTLKPTLTASFFLVHTVNPLE